MRLFDPTYNRQYDPITATIIGSIVGGGAWAGFTSATDRNILTGEPKNTKKNNMQADQQVMAQKQEAEQKALQDQQDETKRKAAARLSMSSSGFSEGASTARSFLTTF